MELRYEEALVKFQVNIEQKEKLIYEIRRSRTVVTNAICSNRETAKRSIFDIETLRFFKELETKMVANFCKSLENDKHKMEELLLEGISLMENLETLKDGIATLNPKFLSYTERLLEGLSKYENENVISQLDELNPNLDFEFEDYWSQLEAQLYVIRNQPSSIMPLSPPSPVPTDKKQNNKGEENQHDKKQQNERGVTSRSIPERLVSFFSEITTCICDKC